MGKSYSFKIPRPVSQGDRVEMVSCVKDRGEFAYSYIGKRGTVVGGKLGEYDCIVRFDSGFSIPVVYEEIKVINQ